MPDEFETFLQSRKPTVDSQRAAIEKAAATLGISPVDYATAMSYESAGTFDPWAKGPVTKWGQHRGTIQYGEPQQRDYGVHEGQSFEDQVTNSNVRYLKDHGVQPGMSFEQIYAAINGGSPNKNLDTMDANTGRSIRDNIRIAQNAHRPKVLARFWNGVEPQDAFSSFVQSKPTQQPDEFSQFVTNKDAEPINTDTPRPMAQMPTTGDRPDVVPEAPETIQAQIDAAADPKVSARAAVLTTDPAQNEAFGNRSDFTMFPTPTGNLWVNTAKAKKLKLKTPQDIQLFLDKNPDAIQKLTGTAVDVGNDTVKGPTVLTTAPDGTELSAKVVTDPKTAEEQMSLDKESFPEGQSQVVDAQDVVNKRLDESNAAPAGIVAALPSEALHQAFNPVLKAPVAKPAKSTHTNVKVLDDETLTDAQGKPLPPGTYINGQGQIVPIAPASNRFGVETDKNAVAETITPPKGLSENDASEYISRVLSEKYGGDYSGYKFLTGYHPGRPIDITYEDIRRARGIEPHVPKSSEQLAEEQKQRVIAPPSDAEIRQTAIDQLTRELQEAFQVNRDRAFGGDTTPPGAPTEEAIQQRIKELQEQQLDTEAKSRAYDVAQQNEGLPGSALSGFYGGVGSGIHTVAGVLRPFGLGYKALSDIGKEMQSVSGYRNKGTGSKDTSEAIASFIGESVPQLAEMTVLPGGPIGKFAFLGAAKASGAGQRPVDIAKAGVEGGITGAGFKKAEELEKPLAKLGTVFGSSMVAGAATGVPLDQNIQRSILNTAFEAQNTFGAKALDKFYRFWHGGEPMDVFIGPRGDVELLKVDPKRDLTGGEVVLDPPTTLKHVQKAADLATDAAVDDLKKKVKAQKAVPDVLEKITDKTSPAGETSSTRNLEFKDGRVFVDGNDVGRFESTPKSDTTLEIDRLYLDKDQQKKGLGRQILEKTFQDNPQLTKIEVYPLGTSEPYWFRFADKVRPDNYVEITRKSFEEGKQKYFPDETAATKPADEVKQSVAPETAEPIAIEDMKPMFEDMGKGIAENLHTHLWDLAQKGETKELGEPSTILQIAKKIRDRGGLQDREEFDQFVKDYGDTVADKRGSELQTSANALVDKYAPEQVSEPVPHAVPSSKMADISESRSLLNDDILPKGRNFYDTFLVPIHNHNRGYDKMETFVNTPEGQPFKKRMLRNWWEDSKSPLSFEQWLDTPTAVYRAGSEHGVSWTFDKNRATAFSEYGAAKGKFRDKLSEPLPLQTRTIRPSDAFGYSDAQGEREVMFRPKTEQSTEPNAPLSPEHNTATESHAETRAKQIDSGEVKVPTSDIIKTAEELVEKHNEERVKDFHKWFGASKVVDKEGHPLVVYHGTPQGHLEFSERDAYFTSRPDVADDYTWHRGPWRSPSENSTVYPAYLSLQNPLEIDALGKRNDNIPVPWKEWNPKVFGNLPDTAMNVGDVVAYAKDRGHDGVIIKNLVDTADITDKTKSDVYVVFHPDQITSAIGNREIAKVKPNETAKPSPPSVDSVSGTPPQGEGEASSESDTPEAPRTVTHPNEAIDGQPIVAETADGKVVVPNPENRSGVSIVTDRGEPPTTAKEPGKPSKIGKNIELKSIEKGLTEGFGGTAEYNPTTIRRQAELAEGVLSDPRRVKRIIAGSESLPEGLRTGSFIKAVEDRAMENADVETLRDLARSPLTSETSMHAQELRMLRERVPDSAAAKMQEVAKARAERFKRKPDVNGEVERIQKTIQRQASKKPAWDKFIDEITCGY